MSKVDKLLQNIFEYRNLLSFLNKNYPTALEEWKKFKIEEKYLSLGSRPATGVQDTQDTTNPAGGNVT